MIYGLDVSHHQGPFDMHRARAEGFEFAFLKATEGSGFVDPRFSANLSAAREAGLLVAAYHYQRDTVSARAQADHIAAVVPGDVPVILDVEDGGGGVNLTRTLLDTLQRRGYRTPLLYLPEWYWQQLGRPDLSGLPPLWKSRYPDNRGGFASGIYQRVPEHFWSDYGGNSVAVLQFTSSASIAGTTPVDANAYRSDRHDLAELLGGTTTQEDDMPTAGDIWGQELHLWHGRDPERETMSAGQQLHQARAYGQLAYDEAKRMRAELAGLREAVSTLASAVGEGDLDVDALMSRIDSTVTEAMKRTVNVDVSVDGNSE